MIVVERLLESSDLAPVTYLITTDPGVSTTYKTKNLKLWEYHSTIIVDICFIIYIRSTNNTHTSNTNLYTSLPFYLLVHAYITDFDSNLLPYSLLFPDKLVMYDSHHSIQIVRAYYGVRFPCARKWSLQTFSYMEQ